MAICDKLKSNYSSYIEGDLPADQYKILDNHFRACPDCRETIREMKIIQQSLKQLSQIQASPDFEQKLHQQIFQQNPRGSFIPSPLHNWKLPAMGSAVILASVGLFLLMNDSSGPAGSSVTQPANLINSAAPQLPGAINSNFAEEQVTPVHESTTLIRDDSIRADSLRINPEGIQQVGAR
jgi:anti-sigma factor RsiW